MANPNWATLATLKSKMYLDLTGTDAARDTALETLGEMITDAMITELGNSAIDNDDPPLALQHACLKQCCYEWKQRATPGLQSVQFQDGSVNKYQSDEWLKEVQRVINKYKKIALYETTT